MEVSDMFECKSLTVLQKKSSLFQTRETRYRAYRKDSSLKVLRCIIAAVLAFPSICMLSGCLLLRDIDRFIHDTGSFFMNTTGIAMNGMRTSMSGMLPQMSLQVI